jgi:predicted lipoprotein
MFSKLLKEKTIAFNNNPTLTSLNEIKIAWTRAFLEWNKLEALNIGRIQESFMYSSIQQWPINTAIIENTINSSVEIDTDFIASIGALGKGYSSIKYLNKIKLQL